MSLSEKEGIVVAAFCELVLVDWCWCWGARWQAIADDINSTVAPESRLTDLAELVLYPSYQVYYTVNKPSVRSIEN